MPTITPPPTPPPPTPPPSAPRSLPSVIVSNPPAALTKLPAGTQFEGTISTAAGRTSVQVTTLFGTLQLQTTLPLEKGARLGFILQNLVPQARLQLASINGQPPQLYLRSAGTGQQTTPAATATGDGATQPAGSAPATPQGLIGTNVWATLLRPAGPASPQGPTPASPATSASAAGPAHAGTAATPAAAPAGSTQQAAAPSGIPPAGTAATAAGPSAAGAQSPTAQGLQQGAQIPLRIMSIQPPPQGAPALPDFPPVGTAPPAVGQTIAGIVSGSTAQGQPIVQTPLGPIALATKAALPPGTEIRFEVTGRAELPESTRPAPLPARPLGLFNAREWPALKEAIETVRAADPTALQHLTARAVPQANSQFTANLVFFLSALRGGDVAGWLGDNTMRILHNTRPNLAARLGDEFQNLGTMSREPLIGDWRLALIPFFNGPDLEPLRLYIKPYGEEEEDDEAKGVRFIIDVNLSRLGRVQLDGLVRDEQKRLDLIVRSETPFDADMQNDIRTIFQDANEATGIKGGVSFQASPPGFLEVSPEEKGGSASDVIV